MRRFHILSSHQLTFNFFLSHNFFFEVDAKKNQNFVLRQFFAENYSQTYLLRSCLKIPHFLLSETEIPSQSFLKKLFLKFQKSPVFVSRKLLLNIYHKIFVQNHAGKFPKFCFLKIVVENHWQHFLSKFMLQDSAIFAIWKLLVKLLLEIVAVNQSWKFFKFCCVEVIAENFSQNWC